MTFITQEESIEAGTPIELFRFANLEDIFTYTSSKVPTVFNSETYAPTAIQRTEDQIESLEEQRNVVVKMPSTDPFVARYFATLPAQQDSLTIYKQHSTDTPTPETVVIFQGKVANVAVTGNEAKVNALSDASLLERTIPMQTSRNLCNHVLYDTRCKVVESQFRIAATVSSISADGLTIGVSTGAATVPFTGLALSAQLTADATFFTGGTLERGNLERRMVRSMIDDGGNTGTIVVLLPFAKIAVNDVFQLFAGCDHRFPTCKDKFVNSENYGGFPYVPRKNPFQSGIEV